ncbi:MAG: hypothetical protein JXC32_10800 [Anaerolineae bacterium]|nr:hypothetical protein [Anaerolineae bacterium]
MAKPDAPQQHATTRYQRIPDAIIDEVQRTYREGGDLYKVAPWLAYDVKRTILAVTLDADRVAKLPLRLLLEDEAALGPATDLKRAVVAELLANLPAAARARASDEAIEARTMTLMEEAGRSPTACPTLHYEPLYRDLAEAALLAEDNDERAKALDWLKRAIAHNLRFEKGDDVVNGLIDLSSAYMQIGDLDQGLAILTRLLERDPADVWVYRFIATGFGVLGLGSLGLRAAARGIELVDDETDEELHDELLMAQFELQSRPRQSREAEISSAVLEAFEAALALPPDAGREEAPEALCQALVPGWVDVPVKAPLRYRDLPEPLRQAVPVH